MMLAFLAAYQKDANDRRDQGPPLDAKRILESSVIGW